MNKEQRRNLVKGVMMTLAYYKAVDSPLTLPQIGRYLLFPKKIPDFTLSELEKTLNFLEEKNLVVKESGLYSKKDGKSIKNNLCLDFLKKEKESQIKINQVRKALRYFSFIPFIKNIYICGSVARKTSSKESDIDFLIITSKRKVWTARFYLTVLSFFLKKKTKSFVARNNKFCLNHYRGFSNLKIEKEIQDIYSASEYSRMLNLSEDRGKNCFLLSNIKWMKKFLPNYNFVKPPLYHFPKSMRIKQKLEFFIPNFAGDLIENLLKNLQKYKVAYSAASTGLPPNSRLVLENNVIMFHLTPRAPKVIEKMRKILGA